MYTRTSDGHFVADFEMDTTYSDILESSGSLYNPEDEKTRESDSPGLDSDLFVHRTSLHQHNQDRTRAFPAKRTRFESVPAKSTPKAGIYDYTDQSEDDDCDGDHFLRKPNHFLRKDLPRSTPTTSLQKNVSLEDLMRKMNSMEAALLGAIGDLRRENDELKRDNKKQRSQIEQLLERVDNIGRNASKETSQKSLPKTSNHIRSAIRSSIKYAEQEKGLKLQVSDGLDSPSNSKVVSYIYKFARTYIPDLSMTDFKAGLARIVTSKKEQSSRHRQGKIISHKDQMRKNQRKSVKSQNRVLGIQQSDLPPNMQAKYGKAMKNTELMSTEESEVDDGGEKYFRVRPRMWDSAELRNAKRLADKNYQMGKRPRTARTKRVMGAPSTANIPRHIQPDEAWVQTQTTNYGLM